MVPRNSVVDPGVRIPTVVRLLFFCKKIKQEEEEEEGVDW